MKKTLKIALPVFACIALAACMFGCSGTLTAKDFKGQTVACEVTKVDGNKVEVKIGELSQAEMPQGGQQGGQPSNGQQPDNQQQGNQQPPAKPDGEQGGQSNDQQPGGQQQSDQPGGQQPNGQQSGSQQPPDMPSGGQPNGGQQPSAAQTFTAGDKTATFDLSGVSIEDQGANNSSMSDIKEGTILSIKVSDAGKIESATIVSTGSGMGGFGGSGSINQGTAANTIDADGTYENKTYKSTGDDENALRVTGATATLSNITVDKASGSSSNTEDGDFYGMNAALLVTNKANATIKNATITSNAKNGNGIFSYGEGTVVNVENTTIKTSANNSGGIQTTGGGIMNAKNLTVETQGNSAAAIRSDRGGGTVNVDGGTYTSNGSGSPAIYSTANITTKNAKLTATNSEALVIEGKNSISLENCEVSGNMTSSAGGSSENIHNVMIYQSMSGDADVGTSSLSINGGSITGSKGDMFYITNTHAKLALSGVAITNLDESGNLLTVSGNSSSRGWGKAGSNGGQLECAISNQILNGNIVVDTISNLTFTMADGSTLNGTINVINNADGGQAVSNNAVVTVGAGCTWNLTGNCKITSLTNNGTINFNGYTITLADGTVLS